MQPTVHLHIKLLRFLLVKTMHNSPSTSALCACIMYFESVYSIELISVVMWLHVKKGKRNHNPTYSWSFYIWILYFNLILIENLSFCLLAFFFSIVYILHSLNVSVCLGRAKCHVPGDCLSLSINFYFNWKKRVSQCLKWNIPQKTPERDNQAQTSNIF